MYAAQIELFVYSLLGLLLAILFCVEVARRYSQLGSAGPALVVFSFCCSVFFGYGVAASFEGDVEDDPNLPRIEAIKVFQERHRQSVEEDLGTQGIGK